MILWLLKIELILIVVSLVILIVLIVKKNKLIKGICELGFLKIGR